MTEKTFTSEIDGTRLDQFLTDRLDSLSRTRIKRLILAGMVTVNNRSEKPGYRIEASDIVTIQIPEDTRIPNHIEPENIPLDVLYEDESILAVNKPPGLVVHPGAGRQTGTLAHALLYHVSTLSDLNGPARPGIIHRLDMDTSGVMVVAKTNHAHHHLAKQFEERTVKKQYTGITWGEWRDASGTIDRAIRRNPNDPTSYIVNENGREAVTLYQVKQTFLYLSLVHFFPKTGRTHQIRVHAAYEKHPIFGDDKYQGGFTKVKGFIPEVSKRLKMMLKSIQRHALHASRLEIIHPETGESCMFTSPLPKDMETVLKQLEHDLV